MVTPQQYLDIDLHLIQAVMGWEPVALDDSNKPWQTDRYLQDKGAIFRMIHNERGWIWVPFRPTIDYNDMHEVKVIMIQAGYHFLLRSTEGRTFCIVNWQNAPVAIVASDQIDGGASEAYVVALAMSRAVRRASELAA